MDSNYIAAHIQCTREEKLICMETVNKLFELLKTARSKGLLALEEKVKRGEYAYPELLRIGIELVVDGTDPAIIKDIFANYLLSSALTNQEFLENMLVCQGILAIQDGENPNIVQERLCAFFGIDFRTDFQALISLEEYSLELYQMLDHVKQKLVSIEKVPYLDFIQNQPDGTIQRILREVCLRDLGDALAGSCQTAVNKCFKNLSEHNKKELYEILIHMSTLSKKKIISNQKKILSIVKELEENKEIILCTESEPYRLTQEEIQKLLRTGDTREEIN